MPVRWLGQAQPETDDNYVFNIRFVSQIVLQNVNYQ